MFYHSLSGYSILNGLVREKKKKKKTERELGREREKEVRLDPREKKKIELEDFRLPRSERFQIEKREISNKGPDPID